jgi:hypothetical protein
MERFSYDCAIAKKNPVTYFLPLHCHALLEANLTKIVALKNSLDQMPVELVQPVLF